MGLSKTEQQEYAKMLYLHQGLSQKEIANRCKVSENTISSWRTKFGWDKIKRSLIIVKDEQINSLYEKLEKLNQHIHDTQDNLVSTKDVDAIIKITAAIKQLETNAGLGETIDVAKKYLEFVRQIDLAFAQQSAEYFDLFIMDKSKA